MIRRKSERRRRTHMLTMRVTDEELEAIKVRAQVRGWSISELLRHSALGVSTTYVRVGSPNMTIGTSTTTVASYSLYQS